LAYHLSREKEEAMAHPTSLILDLDIRTGNLSGMLDPLYVGGETFASASLREIGKSIEKAYTSLIA
jgi:hypothetical protein